MLTPFFRVCIVSGFLVSELGERSVDGEDLYFSGIEKSSLMLTVSGFDWRFD